MANSKIITYDLCSPGRNYDDLYEKIKSYGTWAHICESTWIISTTDSCSDIRDKLLIVMTACLLQHLPVVLLGLMYYVSQTG